MEPLKGKTPDPQRSPGVLTKQQRIAELDRERPQESFTSLNHYLDMEWLTEAVERGRADSAPGMDGQNLADYKAGA